VDAAYEVEDTTGAEGAGEVDVDEDAGEVDAEAGIIIRTIKGGALEEKNVCIIAIIPLQSRVSALVFTANSPLW